MTNEKLTAALWYADLGMQVFPCNKRAKTPATTHGFKDATDEIEQITTWWDCNPEYNLACATGAVSGIIVLDIDKDKGGFESITRLEKKHGRLPSSWVVRTGGGGVHIYFRHPGGDIRNSTSRVGPGIDIRGDGGYVLLPPSTHESGTRYEWKTPPDNRSSLATAPSWLLELNKTGYEKKEIKEWKNLIPHGERHERLVKEAGKLRRLEYEAEEIAELLWVFFQKRCEKLSTDDPDLIRERIKKIAESGCRLWKPGDGEYKLTDKGNAERFTDMFRNKARFCVAWGKWLIWDGHRWKKDDLIKIQALSLESVERIWEEACEIKGNAEKREQYAKWYKVSQKIERINAVIKLAKGMLAVSPEDLDKDPWKINILNGTVDLRTGELGKHNREDLITKMAPVRHDKDAKYPLFRRFINDIMMGDAELIDFLQRFLGYSLTADVRERVFVVFHGNTGSNGKSTLLERIQDVMGEYAIGTKAETLLSKQKGTIRNDIARLKGARFICANESKEGRELDEPTVKELTGGEDTITARFLYGEDFDFRPTFKICLRTNHLPKVSAESQAIWDRIRLVPFKMRVRSENDPDGTVPEDKSLPEKLKGELDGIFMWCLEGCLTWQREGLRAPERVREATGDYRENEDLTAAFLEDMCLVGKGEVSAGDMLKAYTAWCTKNDYKAQRGSQKLKARLERKGFRQKRIDRGRFWSGLALTEEAADLVKKNY